jgi:NAD(P)H-dependent FMN reductase
VKPEDVAFEVYDGLGDLPPFNPDLDGEGMEPPVAVAEVRRLLTSAGAIVISSPEYAHGVPGSLKNLLDWLVSVGELVGKPTALLNASPVGGQFAQAALLETLRTMNWRVVEEACLIAPFVGKKIGAELDEEGALERLREALAALARAARD